jgi:mRNA interferase MazF
VTYERFDVVVVPFPFTDSSASKRRPAVIVSHGTKFNAPAGYCVMAMITSAGNAPWPLDRPIQDLSAAGLSAASVVRMKLFTLDHRFVLRRAGKLSSRDGKSVAAALKTLLG